MAGNEQEIGGYLEDVLVLFSAYRTGIKSILCNVCIGFDRTSGVSDCSSFRAVAELTHAKGFLGCFSLLKEMNEVSLYFEACLYTENKMQRINMVGEFLRNAINGKFGNVNISENQGRIFINPIMAQYYFFFLDKVIKRIEFREFIEDVNSAADVISGVEYYRENLQHKIREEIPRTNQF